jgi:hypothetical protein
MFGDIRKVLAFIATYGTRLEEAWPVLKHMMEDAQQLLTIMNGGKPVIMAAGATTPEGQEVLQRLKAAGIPEDEALQFVQVTEAVEGRLPTI